METLDLFGDVVVTLDDVELWLDAVPQIPRNSPRRNYYVKNWDVSNKIKAAKLAGIFDSIISSHLATIAKNHSGHSNIRDVFFPASIYMQ